MYKRDPDLRRTWLFGPGADAAAHGAMLSSGADVLIVDLEDFTPPQKRAGARELLPQFVDACREGGRVSAVRINALEADGNLDLAAAMRTRPDVIMYPMTDRASQMHSLHAAITERENSFVIPQGSTEIVPVCETALGVVDAREIALGSARIRCALLGSEDLANDLCAERGSDAVELDYARRRFIMDCRAVGVEPIDAPYTYTDVNGAVREARHARRLGYRSKSLVRADHAQMLNDVLTPGPDELRKAQIIIDGFDAARARGEDRALIDGLWVEVPTYRNAIRLIERGRRLAVSV